MKLKPDTYFLIFLILVGIIFVTYALTFSPLEGKLVAILIGSVVIVLGSIQIVRDIKSIRQSEDEDEKEEESLENKRAEIKFFIDRAILLGAWVGSFYLITYLFGFLISVPVFIFVFLKFQDTYWIYSAIAAAATTAFVFGFFELFLLRQLWRGIFELL